MNIKITSGQKFLIHFILLILVSGVSADTNTGGILILPELSIGLAEVPLNNFDFGNHEDTELHLGLSQAFPPGQTLRLRGGRMGSMADAERARVMNRRMLALSEVRNACVDLYYQQEAACKLELNRDQISEMVEITEHQYAQGRDNQHDIMRAQLELPLIEDRIEAAVIAVTQKSVAIAHEQYKPQWMPDFMISDNTASDLDLQTGPDFAGMVLKMLLTNFTDKQQNRQLAASEQEAMAARYVRADRLRELTHLAEGEYANLARLELYHSLAVVEAGQTQEAVFNAYQNDLADFETLDLTV